jgi:hypothetical protein
LFLAKNKRTTRLISAALTQHLGKLRNVQKEAPAYHHAAVATAMISMKKDHTVSFT